MSQDAPRQLSVQTAAADGAGFPPVLLVADFNVPEWTNNLGGAFGAWDNDPGDPTHDCMVRLVESPRLGSEGFSLQIEYDVDSPNPAFNGLWMKLPNIPVARYKTLSFALKGDAEKGYTQRFKIELKDGRSGASYLFDRGAPNWVRYHIPLRAFDGIEKLKHIKEIVIIFEKETVTELQGMLYLEDIRFES